MRVGRFSLMRVRDEEHGAVLAIVAISFICLIGMLVLTFDLGRGVALKRNMVNGADSAALAAASSSVVAVQVWTIGIPYETRICFESNSLSNVRPELRARCTVPFTSRRDVSDGSISSTTEGVS